MSGPTRRGFEASDDDQDDAQGGERASFEYDY